MSKARAQTPSQNLELYEKLVATNPNVEWQATNKTYTSLNGNMFSFLTNPRE